MRSACFFLLAFAFFANIQWRPLDHRRLSHVGIVEEPGGVHLGLRGRGSGRERHPAAHEDTSTGELPSGHSCDAGEEVGMEGMNMW